MGCEQESQTHLRPLAPYMLTIYGDSFDADSRALQAVCEIAGIKATFVDCNMFSSDSRKDEFEEKNPTCSMPFLQDGNTLVLAEEGLQNFKYVISKFKQAAELGPKPETETKFNAVSRYFFKEVRNTTSFLIKRQSFKILHPDKVMKDQTRAQQKMNLTAAEFRDRILVNLNNELRDKDFLVDQKITALDIFVYMELNQVLSMYNWDLPSHLNKLYDWCGRMAWHG